MIHRLSSTYRVNHVSLRWKLLLDSIGEKAHDDRFRRISVPVDATGVLVLGALATRSLNFWLRYCL